jgi:hypothetical protein
MLRPSNSILVSSRAARARSVRAERLRALWHFFRGISGFVSDLWRTALDLFLLGALPVIYLAGAYLVLDLPLRFLAHRQGPTLAAVGELLLAGAVSFVGIARAVQDAAPVAPVRPRFARAMLLLGWVTALLLVVADIAA